MTIQRVSRIELHGSPKHNNNDNGKKSVSASKDVIADPKNALLYLHKINLLKAKF